jgi:hypothetical protein
MPSSELCHACGHPIASPVPQPEKPEPNPGEGWRLLALSDVTATGDERMDGCDTPPRRWRPVNYAGLLVSEYIATYPELKIRAVRRRVAPLPEPPQEPWVATHEWRWRLSDSTVHSKETRAVESRLMQSDADKRWLVLEQKFTRNGETDWRPIPVVSGG